MVLSWKQFGPPYPLDLALYPDIFRCHPWGEGGMLPLASERVETRDAVNILSALDSPPTPAQKECRKGQGGEMVNSLNCLASLQPELLLNLPRCQRQKKLKAAR